MAVQILSRRSITLNDRPFPTRLGAGELAVNTNAGDPGLYFANSTDPATSLIKVGPTHVGTSAPNTSAAGFTSLSIGESWLDTTATKILKIYDGTAWQTVKAGASVAAGYPASPVDGQLHYNTSTSKLAIYILASTSWVNIGP